MPDIAYQLYCSRNSPLQDTCRMLGKTGYRYVEGYGALFENLPVLQEALEAGGLKMISAHMSLEQVESPQGLNVAKALGLKYVFVPFLMPDSRPQTTAGWTNFATRLSEASKPFIKAGITFGWHNHDFEFARTKEGDLPIDLIAAAGVGLELDLGWVKRAGFDPITSISRYASHLRAAHIKDVAPVGDCVDEDGWADVGHGTLNWPAIHSALQSAQVDLYVVEHDNPSDPARFAARSLETVQAL